MIALSFLLEKSVTKIWAERGGGVRAWHSLSPEESLEPDCIMLGIHMLRLSGLTCCPYARMSDTEAGGSVLRVVAVNAFFLWCTN